MILIPDKPKYNIPIFTSKENIRYYHGDSMRGTFYLGDRLVVVPPSQEIISVGDVIVFSRMNGPDDKEEIIHRIDAISENKFITRGDNNLYRDISLVQPDQVIGKIVMVERNGQRQEVVGGSLGLWRVKPRWLWLKVDYWLRRLYRKPYRWLRLSKIIPNLWPIEINEMQIKTDRGPLIKYIYKGRTVATWETSRKLFECREPFDLVIFPPEDLE